MKTLYTFFFFCISLQLLAQDVIKSTISGYVVDQAGNPIEGSIVFILDTDAQTRTDSLGYFTLEKPIGKAKLIIQRPPYITATIDLKTNDPQSLKITLSNNKKDIFIFDDPQDLYAMFLLQLVTKHGPPSTYSYKNYTKGSLKLATSRSSFLGQQRKDLDADLDIRNTEDYIYFGELVSKVTNYNAHYFKEKVEAQYDIGTSKDIFFLTGIDNQMDLFEPQVSNQFYLVSPLAQYGSSYYYYKVIDVQVSEEEILYTVSFTPKRKREPVMEGTLTFTNKNWQIKTFSASLDAENVGLKNIDELIIEQSYAYSTALDKYITDEQNIYFRGKFIIFDYTGHYASKYSNHQLEKDLSKKDFTAELIQYAPNYDNKDEHYWQQARALPITRKDANYFRGTSLLTSEESKQVLDSIDKRKNNFTLFKLLKGYNYTNSFKGTNYNYRGLLSTFAFNAVQGFNVTTGLDYSQYSKDNGTTKLGVITNYGIAENKFRFSGYASHLFNEINYNQITLSGGSTILQFNQDQPIKTPINSFASSWFGKNYAKFFEKRFFSIHYEQYAFTGLKLQAEVEYAERKTLKNHLRNSPFVPSLDFSSNNPLDPKDFEGEPFKNNNIYKFSLGANIVFDQKIISYPNQKQYLPVSSYPTISLNLVKGLNASYHDYSYTFVSISSIFNKTISNYGNLYFGISAGKFLEQNDIAFTDYKHFNGNQTFIGSSNIYNKQFNLLPYYEYSTNKDYLEVHMEHDFRGYLMNKIPLLNRTRYSFVLGFHMLNTAERGTYREMSIGLNNFGFGKFRPFRLDFFTTLNDGEKQKQGIILGIKILDMIQK